MNYYASAKYNIPNYALTCTVTHWLTLCSILMYVMQVLLALPDHGVAVEHCCAN